MSEETNQSAKEEAEGKSRAAAAKLDKATEPLGGTSEMESHAKVGYTVDHVEERAEAAADEEGVTLYRNPDGSHTAIDESNAAEYADDSDRADSKTDDQ